MEITLHSSSSSSAAAVFQSISSLSSIHHLKTSIVTFRNGNYSHYRPLTRCPFSKSVSCSAVDGQRRIISVESHFCYDKEIPEQIIEQPVGLSVTKKEIGDRPHCGNCQAKGAVLCTTCVGSGLYVDSILECQGIVVKVRCLADAHAPFYGNIALRQWPNGQRLWRYGQHHVFRLWRQRPFMSRYIRVISGLFSSVCLYQLFG